MGLNLETLIGILVILILLIVADGLRRMLRDRHSRLRVKIDPRFRDQAEAETEDYNPELPSGSARVVRPVAPQPSASREAPALGDLDSLDEQDPDPVSVPPVVMEAEARRAARAPEPANQQDLFAAPAAKAGNSAGTAKAQRKAAVVQPELLEVIVVHMVAPAGEAFPGRDLLARLLEQGMRYGEMNIFHRHQPAPEGGDELQFSMANAVEPGTFDIDRMEKETFRGITFFLKLPGPSHPIEALDRMLATARSLAQGLGGELKDEQRSVLTPQTAEHLRQRVQEFERRLRLGRGH